jgi:hypothetical protein
MTGFFEGETPERRGAWRLAALVSGAVILCAPPLAQAAPPGCDRACLHAILDRYLAAVVAHDPVRAPLAAGAVSTENAVATAPGEGVWKNITGLGSFQRRYFDAVTGQAAYLGLIQDGAGPALVSVRLKVVGRKVTEAEWTIAHQEFPGSFVGDLVAAPPSNAALPASQRESRAELLTAAQSYFKGLQAHDGAVVQAEPGCVRIENGAMTAGPLGASGQPRMAAACNDKFPSMMAQISEVAHRRFPLVDQEAGMVLGMGIFHRPPGALRRDGKPWPRNLLTEYFQVRGKRITGIYAVMHYMDADAPDSSGWPDDPTG